MGEMADYNDDYQTSVAEVFMGLAKFPLKGKGGAKYYARATCVKCAARVDVLVENWECRQTCDGDSDRSEYDVCYCLVCDTPVAVMDVVIRKVRHKRKPKKPTAEIAQRRAYRQRSYQWRFYGDGGGYERSPGYQRHEFQMRARFPQTAKTDAADGDEAKALAST